MLKASRWIMREKQHVALESFDYDPAALGPREIAVRVEYTVISPGTECANYLALDPDVLKPNRWCSYPWTPGYSGVGRIIGVGDAVNELAIGDRVVGRIRHRSHITLSVDAPVIRIADDVNPEHAAWLPIVGIGATPIYMLKLEPLPIVGVWGLGMIGNFAAQMLGRAGGSVVGIDPLPERRDLARRCGITQTLDLADPAFAQQVARLTSDRGFDVAVDTTGHAPTTLAMAQFVRKRGQMVLLTHWRSQPVLDAGPFLYDLFVKGISLIGAHETTPLQGISVDPIAWQRDRSHRIANQIKTGGIAVEPLISHRITPRQCKEAYEGLCFDRGNWWGVVVDWREAGAS